MANMKWCPLGGTDLISRNRKSDGIVDPALQRRFGRSARPVRNYFAILENEQRRNAPNTHGRSGVGVAVNIDLGDLDLAFVFCCKLFQGRTDLFAWAAPFGPEIHHYGDI